VGVKRFVKDFRRELQQDNLGDVAAMMTYYAIFALFPMAVFVLTIALLVIPPATIQEGVKMLTETMPGQAGTILSQHAARLQSSAGGGLAIGSALLALWGASRGAVSLGRALNGVYDKQETRPWWKVQLTGISVTLVVSILLLLALGLLSAGPAVGAFVAETLRLGEVFDVAWTVTRWIGAGVLVMFIWALLYRFLPNTHAPLRVFTPGAFVGVALWIGASLLFALYVNHFGKYEKTYGALGAVIVFLTWLYLSNLALLVGAEINDVLEQDDAEPAGRRTPTVERSAQPVGGGRQPRPA
jgi:membrane protein